MTRKLFRGAWPAMSIGSALLSCNLVSANAMAAAAAENLAFPEKFMLRLTSYSVRDADTDMTVLSSASIGTGFSFADDLGGDDSVTIPRIDGFYRFDYRHRVEFATYRIERDGRNLLEIDLDIGDQNYSIGETVVSDIDYELFKLAYVYSFYHSASVELALSAGLNVTTYEFDYRLADGSSADSSEASGPLPMFGLRMSYRINPRWSVHYLTESFFINIGDDLEGSFQNMELNIEYRFRNNLALGAGSSRFSTNLDARDSEWNGRLADSHRGLLVYGSYIFR